MKELSKKKKVAMCIVLACSMFFMFLGIGLNNCSPNSNAGKTYVEPYTKYTYTLSYGETKEVYFLSIRPLMSSSALFCVRRIFLSNSSRASQPGWLAS